jgi:hypothetical protein
MVFGLGNLFLGQNAKFFAAGHKPNQQVSKHLEKSEVTRRNNGLVDVFIFHAGH